MTEKFDTLIIGGGQAGLSTSYHLSQQGRDHVVLERADGPASAWRHRWDSFALNTPNWTIRLPGAEYQGDDPDGFMVRDDIINYFEEYASQFALPLRCGIQVTSVDHIESGYRVSANGSMIEAANVVIATGLHQRPRIPACGAGLPPEIQQLHSDAYRNPDALLAGAVLVVGSAQSGAQIAEELLEAGRRVYLSVSSAGRAPRRYRGKDVTRWFSETGAWDKCVDTLKSPLDKFAASPHVTGREGGHTINLHRLARDGLMLLGRVKEVYDGRITFRPDLMENLAKADRFEAGVARLVDDFVARSGLEAPTEILPIMRDGYSAEQILELNLKAVGISSVIWATGYGFDFNLVRLSAFDEDGYPVQKRGVSGYPGLFFVGLPFLHTMKSGLLVGVGDDAGYVAAAIARRKTR